MEPDVSPPISWPAPEEGVVRAATAASSIAAEQQRELATLFFSLCLALALLAPLLAIDRFPWEIDFDCATLGIFVNNLAFHHGFAYSFENASEQQESYRALWAATALPLTLPIALLERWLRLAPSEAVTLLRVVAALLALAGGLAAALALRRRRRPEGAGLILGLTIVFPAFLLYLRTGFPNVLLPFLLFWAGVLVARRYGETGRPAFLYALAPLLAYGALNAYPSLLPLPALLAAVLAIHGRFRAALRSPHTFLAAALSFLLWQGTILLLGRHFVGSAEGYRRAIASFRLWRGGAVSLFGMLHDPIGPKLQKLADQHLLFRLDSIANFDRPDGLWTLGSPHWTWLALLPLLALGLVVGLRLREKETAIAAAAIVIPLVFFLTASFPQGRYLLILVPAYMALAARGLEALAQGTTARRTLGAALLLLFTIETSWRVATLYGRRASCQQVNGIVEAARLAQPATPGVARLFSFPMEKTYQAELLFRMLTDNAGSWITPEELERAARCDPRTELYVVCPAADSPALASWLERGFTLLGCTPAESSAGPLAVLGSRKPAADSRQ